MTNIKGKKEVLKGCEGKCSSKNEPQYIFKICREKEKKANDLKLENLY